MVCMRVAFHENDGNHENGENDEDNLDSYEQGVECWIRGNHGNHGNVENHGNPGCKPRVPQTTALEIPGLSKITAISRLLPLESWCSEGHFAKFDSIMTLFWPILTCFDLFRRADPTYFHLFRPIRQADLTYFHLFRPISFHNKAPWTGRLRHFSKCFSPPEICKNKICLRCEALRGAFYLQLTTLAFLLTIGVFLLTLLASLLTVGAFLLRVGKWI